MESYELVESFEQAWNREPKNSVLETSPGGNTQFGVFVNADNLRVYVSLLVGPRGGIRETVTVIDPRQHIVADRLVLRSTNGGDLERGLLLPLAEIRKRVMHAPKKRRDLAIQLCRTVMQDYVEMLNEHPLRAELLLLLPSTSNSITGVLSGGAPGLSMRRRGGGVNRKS